ncbi:TolC family protein [Paraliomyxa miuraensis]|uniref:TolC family protein n=1 Tax=Paraliomyxa miuraensis TaxID=376150 RepID=UPI0022590EB8|nr:efflux transporter outer membrane subunit [Paraliomyxa miuraensis]MCX4247114.1 efflux transporter outer membrane subunit [Paraliomyxa miuraensis]
MSKRWSEVALVIAGAWSLLGLGCTSVLGSNQAREANTEVPASFGAVEIPSGPSVATQKRWDEFFSDPQLRALIEQALEHNQELNIQLQELIITQNEAAAVRGEYLPRLEAGVGTGIEKVGEETSQGASDADHGVAVNLPDFRFGFKASWETDVWSRFRSARKAASLRYEATIHERNFLVTELVAELAKSYYDLLALDNQIEILDRNIGVLEDALEVVRLKKAAARDTELGVKRFEAEVLENQGRKYTLEQQRSIVENRINFLVGRFPQPVERSSESFLSIDVADVTTGLPSELLDNRPDVKAAEMRLEAAELDTTSAKARFYPSLSLEAELGYQSFNLGHLIATPESLAYGLAGNLMAPLLNRAAIKADYRSANARQIQAVYDFERTLLQAYTDVYNQLTTIANLRERYERLSRQVAALQAAIEVSSILYQSAKADYYEVLMTRRDSLEAEMELVEAKKEQLQAIVAVYQALGGGWRREP